MMQLLYLASIMPNDTKLEPLVAQMEACWSDLARFMRERRAYGASRLDIAAELSHAQLQALHILVAEDCRVCDLAGRLGLAESTTTRLVDRLEAEGLVARAPSSEDRRAVVVALTLDGRATAKRLRAGRRELLRQMLAGLSSNESRQFVRLFTRVTESLSADERPAGTTEDVR
ncbi:MAG: MarR family transcriptional regulator [Actinomycetota bacterium]